MTNKKTLIIDCDGVLYPSTDITMFDFVKAVKESANYFGITDEQYEKISQNTKASGSLGIFNFVYNLCNKDDNMQDEFNKKMVEHIDYSKIKEDKALLKLLNETQKKYNIVVLTNNSRPHLEQIAQKRFGKNINDLGFECYDISHTKYKDKFYPKQSELGLKLFTQRIGVNLGDCVLVDDSQRNIDVAKEIGISGVLITEDFALGKYLKSLQTPTNIVNKKENTH